MSVLKGGAIRAYYVNSAIGHATSCSLNLSADTVEIDDKDITTHPEYKAVKVKGTLSVDAFFSYSTLKTKPFDLARLMLAKTAITLKVESETPGQDNFNFSGIITNMDFEYTVNSIAVYSVVFQITGDITIDLAGLTVIGDSEGTVIGDTGGFVIGW